MVKIKLPKIFRKAWEKQPCTFELQEYGVRGGKGWSSVIEPTGSPPSVEEAREYFKPGNHYRVIARHITGDKAGQYAGVVWEHYEVHKGLSPREKPKRKVKKESQVMDIVSAMDGYADEVGRVLKPLGKLLGALDTIREQLGGGQTVESQPSESQWPMLEFEGKPPWMLHPYIVHTIAEEVKGIIDYGATRIEGVIGGPKGVEGPPEEAEEEPLLPSARAYLPPKVVEEIEEEEAEEEFEEEEVEEEEEPLEEVEEEIPVEEEREVEAPTPPEEPEMPEQPETVPSLVKKEEAKKKVDEELERLGLHEQEKAEEKTEE